MAKEKMTYDAVIVGGGLSGLTLASYLGRAGMSVGIFEERFEEGSGVHTTEYAVPGFHMNHAQYGEFFSRWVPTYYDFNLDKLGAKFIYPEVQAGIAFSDGRPPICFYNVDLEDGYERTYKSIAQYSKHDAETWVRLRKIGEEVQPMLYSWLFNPPPLPSDDNQDPFHAMNLMLMDVFGIPRHYVYASTQRLIDSLFESPEMRTYLYKHALEWLAELEGPYGGVMGLFSMFILAPMNWSLSIGGTHTVAHAVEMAAVKEGAHYHETSRVAEITITNGRATGVLLSDGTQVEARKMVISSADIRQTVCELVGEKNSSPLWTKQASEIEFGPAGVLGSSMFAVNEVPDYKSARHDPAINKCFYTVSGFDTPEEVLQQCRQKNAGLIPDIPGVGGVSNSLWDPTYAPAGKHTFQAWLFFPKASSLTRKEWAEVKESYNDRILERLVKWAPNMTRDNIIGDHFETPQDLEDSKGMIEGEFTYGSVVPIQSGHMRPFPEAAHYRSEIEGLYLCGGGMHPMGGINGGVGYNVYKILAEDHKLDYRPWEGREELPY